ncbi:hypothetical protein PbB2_02677 [Candidatus Phycosocius bacilliformis]|uniref:Uncharacterized protein n=1 Tax=Candidatus Phycosocius bacilliformis TaxID=1445552 RepID=A0A2P2ED54_9PROT|nr:hypothetical protein PbB2_02677 [Candidatus Phycosocius bacilliformis]
MRRAWRLLLQGRQPLGAVQTARLSWLPVSGDALAWLKNCLRRRFPSFFDFKGPSFRFAPARAKPLCATDRLSLLVKPRFARQLIKCAWTLQQVLCHLKFGPFGVGVFCRSFPWLDEEVWHESIEVHVRAESVRREARRRRNASRVDLSQGRDQPGDILQLEETLCWPYAV